MCLPPWQCSSNASRPLILLGLFAILIAMPRAGIAQEESPIRTEPAVTAECDSDLDGAFLFAAIGSSPIVVGLLGGSDSDPSAGWLLLGVVGGIAGFWGGLAYDSADCRDPLARGEDRVSVDEVLKQPIPQVACGEENPSDD